MKNSFKALSEKLLDWYDKNARDLPWRKTRDPYRIWLSEIMLQQTTVEQGLPYYERFLKRFPRLNDLSDASPDDVLKLWEGLGYYSRARNLHITAQQIVEKLSGKFPDNYNGLLALKGVGPYTAAAISSFCFDEPRAVIDGNVIRFLSRLYGIEGDAQSSEVKKTIHSLAQKLISESVPAVFNQAIMEFGALKCTPKIPQCSSCIFKTDCIALKTNKVDVLPFKPRKIKKRDRYFFYGVFLDPEGRTLIRKRTNKDIWLGLYDFPLVEYDVPPGIIPGPEVFGFDYGITSSFFSDTIKHVLSHQRIFARFIRFKTSHELVSAPGEYILIPLKQINEYPLPRLIALHLNDLSITLF